MAAVIKELLAVCLILRSTRIGTVMKKRTKSNAREICEDDDGSYNFAQDDTNSRILSLSGRIPLNDMYPLTLLLFH